MGLLAPVDLARLSTLAVRARTIVEGALSGVHRNLHPGTSLEFTEHIGTEDDILLKCVAAEIARLLAEGKIDIHTDVKVRFVGDKRVLEDIRILAENGYGEDRFGNNIPLPPKLSYLSR